MNTFIVEPTYYRRLTHFGRQCDPRVRPLFDDSLTDDCIMDCVRKQSIDKYNCIEFKRSFGFIRWKRDIIEDKHIICNYSNEEINNTIIYDCINKCQFDCELGLYKLTHLHNFNHHYDNFLNNYIIITIIPKSNLIVRYEEKYVMDGWELIYQLGGVVGMWIGWSAVSIGSITNKIYFITKIIKLNQLSSNIIKYFYLLLYFLKCVKIILIKICFQLPILYNEMCNLLNNLSG